MPHLLFQCSQYEGFWKLGTDRELHREKRRSPWILDEQARAKAEVSRNATRRIKAYERALEILPHFERARDQLQNEYYKASISKDVSDEVIAKRLNQYGIRPPGQGEWSRKLILENLKRAPDRIIECAVLECRTRMTEMALSADFSKPLGAGTELEEEYLGYIAKALEIRHRLYDNAPRTPEALLVEARFEAIEVAARQRASKPVSMMARERLWKHFPPVVRKVFES